MVRRQLKNFPAHRSSAFSNLARLNDSSNYALPELKTKKRTARTYPDVCARIQCLPEMIGGIWMLHHRLRST